MTDRERVLVWFVSLDHETLTAADRELAERLKAGGALDPKPKKARAVRELPQYAYRLASMLYDGITSNNPNSRVPSLDKWATEFDKMIRNDNRAPRDVGELVVWSQRDSFWSTVILSPAAFRKNYDKLTMARQRSQRNATPASDAKPLPPPSKGQEL